MLIRLITAPVLGKYHDAIMKMRREGGGRRRIAAVLSRYEGRRIDPSHVGKYLKRVKEVGKRFDWGEFPSSIKLGLKNDQVSLGVGRRKPKIYPTDSIGPEREKRRVFSRVVEELKKEAITRNSERSYPTVRKEDTDYECSHIIDSGEASSEGRDLGDQKAGLKVPDVGEITARMYLRHAELGWWKKEVKDLTVLDILAMDFWYAELRQELEKGERRATVEEARLGDMVLELSTQRIRSKEEKKGRTNDRPVEFDYVFKLQHLKEEFEDYERRPRGERWAREQAGLSLPLEIYFPGGK